MWLFVATIIIYVDIILHLADLTKLLNYLLSQPMSSVFSLNLQADVVPIPLKHTVALLTLCWTSPAFQHYYSQGLALSARLQVLYSWEAPLSKLL